MSESYRFGGGASETALTPLALALIIAGSLFILMLPRRWVNAPLLATILLVPMSQTVVISGIHLFAARIVILIGLLRLGIAVTSGKSGVLAGDLNRLDEIFCLWSVTQTAAFMVLYAQSEAIVNQSGFLLDTLGGYFLLRFTIHNEEDIKRASKIFAVLVALISLSMLNEHQTGINLFGCLGGPFSPEIRDGKLRSQGPFAHPLLAGVFAATMFPLFVRLWSIERARLWAIGGSLGSVIMVITSASSTPLGSLIAGIAALCLWPFRRHMRWLRWGIAGAILLANLLMKAPVWFALTRIDLVGGSSSYHRALLIDQCVRHFGDWWLLGTNKNQTWGWDVWDVQNYFVVQAFRGGIATLILFILMVAWSFKRIGIERKRAEPNRQSEWLQWTLGSVLFAHMVAFFGADYFDQTKFWWFAFLAMVSAARDIPCKRALPKRDGKASLVNLLSIPLR
jgi:hypothetical protein